MSPKGNILLMVNVYDGYQDSIISNTLYDILPSFDLHQYIPFNNVHAIRRYMHNQCFYWY